MTGRILLASLLSLAVVIAAAVLFYAATYLLAKPHDAGKGRGNKELRVVPR